MKGKQDKELRKKAIRGAEVLVNEKINESIKSVIKQLEDEQESILEKSEEELAEEIKVKISRREGLEVREAEQLELSKAGYLVKSLIHIELRKTIERIKKEFGIKG